MWTVGRERWLRGLPETIDDVRAPRSRPDRSVDPVFIGDTAWTIVTDEFDVQHVVRASISPIAG